MKKVSFTSTEYLGGLEGVKPTKASTNLWIRDDGIGHGAFGPKHGLVPWSDMAGVAFDSGTAKKSRAGKALAVGVFALAASKTQNEGFLTIQLKDGNASLYRVVGKSGQVLRGKIQPFLAANGVPCLDDAPSIQSAEPTPISAADEIGKLAALHQSGALTDEEFAAHKAKLL